MIIPPNLNLRQECVYFYSIKVNCDPSLGDILCILFVSNTRTIVRHWSVEL